ncbi:hypothetical protein RND81_14G252200 [Saponaria officinalis]|uniref:AB hydrolase-1 domain-containing protein n=1 Tax=Saponaria officinalis TaxID=3572 RepID=A0AAW1GRK4_SAPOF
MNIFIWYASVLYKILKYIGMQPKQVEIEKGTTLHFIAPYKRDIKKPNVVLLHGFAGDGLITWHFQILSLRKKYNIYVPDFLFFGKSFTSTSERSTRFQADCVAKGLKKLGVDEKCVVVGFSYGGFVGFELAEHYPELVGSMIATGSVVGWSETRNRMTLERLGFSSLSELLLPVSVDGAKTLLDVGSYSFPYMPTFIYKHFLEIMFNNRKERAELLEALVIRDQDVSTHQFQQIIHLIWGSEDQLMNVEVAKSLKERLGGKGKLQVVEMAGHLVLQERPFMFNKYLKDMLSSLAIENPY